MSIRELGDGAWAITMPIGPGFLSIYLVRGDRLALIDTGYRSTLPLVDAALGALGLDRADLDVVLLTHGHADHVGACAELGGSALLHAADHELAGGAAAHAGSPVDPVATMRALGRDAEADARVAFLHREVSAPIASVEAIADGDSIDLGGGCRLDVVHLPGHTPGSVAFVWEDRGLAFAGDAVQAWGGRRGVLPLYYDATTYERSLRRIAELEPRTLALGHPFRWSGAPSGADTVRTGPEVARTIADSLAYVRDARVAVQRALDAGCDTPAALAARAIDALGPPYRDGGPDWETGSAAALLAHAEAMDRGARA